jgi:hypothetical protein
MATRATSYSHSKEMRHEAKAISCLGGPAAKLSAR